MLPRPVLPGSLLTLKGRVWRLPRSAAEATSAEARVESLPPEVEVELAAAD